MTADADRYTHGHHASVVQQHARRTAEADAAYLLPHLRSGMQLLDVGCGPGTITSGLAKVVAPGPVIGVDVVPEVLQQAQAHVERIGQHNVHFEAASAYHLPYEDGRFDSAHAHQVLQHLARPVDAAREVLRVLRPGAPFGVRDADYGTMTHWPRSAGIERWLVLYHDVALRNGAEPDAGRRLPTWLQEAGFGWIDVSATTVTFADRDATINWGDSWAERVTQSAFAEQAVEYDLATREELDALAEAWRAWARAPDALFFYVNVECVAWKA